MSTKTTTGRLLRTLAVLGAAGTFIHNARGDGVSAVLTAKTLPAATIAVIDPESGSSSGGGTTDVNVAVGDVILFKFIYFPVPDKIIRGLQGYLTEYVPQNTQVVGVRYTDANGLTVEPNYPGIATDGCAKPCNGFDSVPSSSGTRNLADGSLSQVYADTGIFYTTDTRLARNPFASFISLVNGTAMTTEPRFVSSVSGIIGAASPFFVHNAWDWTQVRAYGTSTASSGNSGSGNTPFGYGSPVAGPQTFYSFEATEPTAGTIQFNDVVGPWNRVVYPGSQIGSGAAVTGSGPLQRMNVPTGAGFDVTPRTPMPVGTRAVRFAGGEVRVGQPLYAEIALRVTGTPIDPLQGQDVDCAETTGGDTSAASSTVRAKDNPWGLYLGSPACAFLNLLYDVTVDDTLVTVGDVFTVTLHGKNLSINPQTNVVRRLKFDGTHVAFNSATGSAVLVLNCEGDGLDCVVWPTVDLLPSDEYTFTATFTAGGGGHVTDVFFGRYISTQLPSPGFLTQSIAMAKGVGIIGATLASTTVTASAGGTASFTGTLSNGGSGDTNMDTLTIVLPAGWTITGPATKPITINGASVNCDSGCTTNTPTYNVPTASFPVGTSRPIAFTANVPGGTATGLYPVDLQIWGSQAAFGGSFETYFPKAALQPVGQPRSTPPVMMCPINKSDTVINGTTVEAVGTTIRVYFNLILRSTCLSLAGGGWSCTGFADPMTGTFGPLYGGLEVSATAQAPGELESPLSARCEVTNLSTCLDFIDNDGDGLTDFPADPGCASAADGDETDPLLQCSDTADNDTDGTIDWPADISCYGPEDTTESGPAQCADGVDNDGDGLADFPADTGCTSATDGNEVALDPCQDGVDNDGDTLADFPADPGCHSANDDNETNLLPSAEVKARLLVVFDTSGSMNWNTCNNTFTGGDGSNECPGSAVTCATCPGSSTCPDAFANDSRIDKVKQGLYDVVAGFGEVDYALMRFHQRAVAFACPGQNASLSSGGWQGGGAAPCPGGFDAADLLVSFSPDNQYDMLEWMDGEDNYVGTAPAGMDVELRGSGTTPLAGSLNTALAYLNPLRAGDTTGTCRPYRVILVTDGAESCGGNPSASAAALFAAGFPVSVIGFATPDATTISNLNGIASSGGTGSAIFVDDAAALSTAMASIVTDSILVEYCNELDDDCDVLVDEDFLDKGAACTNGLLGACLRTGTRVCRADGLGTQCNALPATGTAETCNGIDDDCNGLVDDGIVCTPCTGTEICNGADDDCDGFVDEAPIAGVGDVCGLSIGACTPGTLACTGGTLTCVGATNPTAEVCNNIDDNCDTIVDGMTEECYTGFVGCTIGVSCDGECRTGYWTCTAGSFGTCIGEITPVAELCNGLDDDCDGLVDEDFPLLGTICDNGLAGTCMTTGLYQCLADGSGVFCTAAPVGGGLEVCNAIDDDCDGLIDEPVLPAPIGNPCGGGGTCVPGTLECVGGVIMCVGGSSGTPEICNGLDDDCDGLIDEPVLPDTGGQCTDPGFEMIGDTGTCEFGDIICVDGMLQCDGYIGPGPEICNGLDDDCDGIADDMAECPLPEDLCYQGACVAPCGPGEFPCPFSFTCMTFPEGDFCIPSLCTGVTCPDGFECDEGTGMCVDRCLGVACRDGETCQDGFCLDCFDLGCPVMGEHCVANDMGVGLCEPDLCFLVMCTSPEFCDPLDGTCKDLCDGVMCPVDRVCRPSDGMCVAEICDASTCTAPLVCDPVTGECIADPCVGVTCPAGQFCTVAAGGVSQCVELPGYDVFATSGGGCTCQADGGRGAGRSAAGGGLLLLALGGVVLVRRRRQGR